MRRAAKIASLLALAGLIWMFVWPTYLGGGTSYVVVSGPSMEPVYESGDLVVAREQAAYTVGDIVVFRTENGDVIHRIIGGDAATGFVTQGDNNPEPDTWTPTEDEVVGEAWLRLPAVGEYVLTAKQVVLTPPMPYLIAGFVFLVILLGDDRPLSRRRDSRDDRGASEPVPQAEPLADEPDLRLIHPGP
jgi:signal peptidase I